MRPVLYSFRRCPYAIRARLALMAAGYRPGGNLEVREVSLKAKPPELLALSKRATVPVLQVSTTKTWGESLEIMAWALGLTMASAAHPLVLQNDGAFKHHLDRYKYPGRYPGEAPLGPRQAGLEILRAWQEPLAAHKLDAPWLLGVRPGWLDWALLPFVRQFRLVDPDGFDAEKDLELVQAWLRRYEGSAELAAVMELPWAGRRPWRSPSWLYHLALAPEWYAAKGAGRYCCSTRGVSLGQIGFIHASAAHQVEATYRRFYADAEAAALGVVLLCLDPARLDSEVRWQADPTSGELFPHLYGPLPVAAVRWVEPMAPLAEAP